jgi:N-acetylglucosamine-6-phosphate deacetylase
MAEAKSMQLIGKLIHTGEPAVVTIENGVITRIDPGVDRIGSGAADSSESRNEPDTGARIEGRGDARGAAAPEAAGEAGETLPWIAPGLIDLQINGYAGVNFNEVPIRAEQVHAVTRRLLAEGVTGYLPTVTTNRIERMTEELAGIAACRRADPLVRAAVPGIHLEGPFITPEDGARGAHRREHVRAPDWELFTRFQEAADGLIRIITLSPEWEGAEAFIARCVGSGVIVSIGHTSASPDQIRRAVQAGARMSTHLGNGTHPILPRHPN